MWLVRSNKAAGGFCGFQKVTSDPAGKEGNLQHDIWYSLFFMTVYNGGGTLINKNLAQIRECSSFSKFGIVSGKINNTGPMASQDGLPSGMAQYHVLASKGRQRYKNIPKNSKNI
jgi:hypothetical protein